MSLWSPSPLLLPLGKIPPWNKGREGSMEISRKTCPACGSQEYQFRCRRKVPEEGKPEAVETKYRCKACNHECKVKAPG
jgi:C4-type Zn-finger protein